MRNIDRTIGFLPLLWCSVQIQSAAAAVPWDDPSVFGYFPIRWQEQEVAPTYCDHDDFLDVMDALELGMEATYTESVDLQRTDTPQCSMAELSAGCDNNRVVFMSTHHGHDAEFLIAGFATQSARDAALAVVRATYGNSYFAATDPGFPGIKMTTTGVTDLMQNRIGDNGIFFHSACESNSSIDNWFNPAPPYVTNVGPTMLAYDSNCSIYLGCRELSLFAKVLGCQVLGIDPDTYSAYLLTKNLHAGVLLHHGNIYNRLNPHIDCLNPRTNVLAVDLNHGSATWVAAMDRADTIYEVYWRDHNGSLISQMNVLSEGDVDEGLARIYSADKPSLAALVEVVAVSADGQRQSSGIVEVGQGSGSWGVPGQVLPLFRPEARRPTVESDPPDLSAPVPMMLDPDPEEDCADVVVYGVNWGTVLAVAAQFQGYDTDEDYMPRVKTVVGTGDLTEAREAIIDAVAANLYFMDNCMPCERSYPVFPGPLVVLVGDYGDIDWFTYPDDEYESCHYLTTSCRSFYDVADLDGDGDPECPVQVVPSANSSEVAQILSMAEQWNAGHNVDSGGTVGVLCYDTIGSVSYPGLVRAGQELIDEYASRGQPNAGLLVHSQITPGQADEAAEAAVNAGVRDVWALGAASSHEDLVNFLNPSSIGDLTTKQRICIFAPSCATGYIGSGGTPPFAEAIMLADTSGTVAAGFVGCLNGAWDIQHRTFADKLEENLGESSPGAALTKVVFDTVRDLHDAGYGHYARGITMYGGHLLVREDNAPTSVETPSPTTAFDIIVRPNPTRGQIIIETRGSVLPGGLRFAVFDASGRRVREITQDPANELLVWDGRDGSGEIVPSGTYLIRASAMGRVVSRKVIVVQ